MKASSKIINDPLYGFISLQGGIILNLVEHPYFQRLRRISQLGLTSLVYPGALHTRFHHAIGAMHLMQKAINVLRSKGHEISVEEAYKAATLCADLTLATLSSEYKLETLTPINVVGFVNSDSSFTDHASVLNGFTDKLAETFNEKATRSAVGVASLPLNVSVEVQSIFMIND